MGHTAMSEAALTVGDFSLPAEEPGEQLMQRPIVPTAAPTANSTAHSAHHRPTEVIWPSMPPNAEWRGPGIEMIVFGATQSR